MYQRLSNTSKIDQTQMKSRKSKFLFKLSYIVEHIALRRHQNILLGIEYSTSTRATDLSWSGLTPHSNQLTFRFFMWFSFGIYITYIVLGRSSEFRFRNSITLLPCFCLSQTCPYIFVHFIIQSILGHIVQHESAHLSVPPLLDEP